MGLDSTIAQCLIRFFRALDDADYASCVASFADDGTWHRQGKLLEGRAMLGAALAERPSDFHTRHIISNTLIGHQTADEVEVSFYSTVFAHRGDISSGPPPISAPAVIAVYDAQLMRIGGKWLIRSLRSTPIFRNGH